MRNYTVLFILTLKATMISGTQSISQSLCPFFVVRCSIVAVATSGNSKFEKKRLFNGRKERFVVGRPTDTSRFALSWHDKFSLVRISVTEKKPTKEKR